MRTFTLPGTVRGTYWAPRESQTFTTMAIAQLLIEQAGIAGDRHFGHTRFAGGREPRYPKGSRILNMRMLTAVSTEELAEIARKMEIARVRPEWLGANLLLSEIPDLSSLPPMTRLRFPSGACLICTGENNPCKAPGKVIQGHYPQVTPEQFSLHAQGLRGITLTVEMPGVILPGDEVTVEIPRQTLYAADVQPEG